MQQIGYNHVDTRNPRGVSAPEGMTIVQGGTTMKEIISGIYEIRNTVNGHRYIGSSVDIYERIGKHRRDLNNGKHHSKYLQYAFNKYGMNSFEFSILETCPIFSLISREQHYLDVLCPEYNMASNAAAPMLNKKHTDETRIKMSKTRKNISDETRRRMSESQKGRKHSEETRQKISNWHRGKVVSSETKNKISASKTGEKMSEGTRRALFEANKARVFSDETKKKISEALKGRVFSSEHRRKISEAAKKRVISEEQRRNMSIAQKKRWDKNNYEDEKQDVT